ncbi:uncharacterized protein CDAR_245761 [Caerostris darwini]|uniref:Uncharacterized protein n=1 Tax=Caerostris darwini TaxID=1538125 RepID=A0AAV4S3P7_9ARAC|nr:uncharacterized protein CDAR_245761 [Caerostris darwini]
MPVVLHGLQQLALAKVAVTLCKNPTIESELSKRCRTPEENINGILFAVTKVLSSMDIPLLFKKKLLRCFACIIFEYHNWVKRHYNMIDAGEHFRSLCWKPCGMIDEQKSLESLIRNQNIPVRERFHLACMYCFKEDILSLWNQMSSEEQKWSENSSTEDVWVTCIIKADSESWPKSSEDYPFKKLLIKSLRNSTALRNLLEMLEPEERHRYQINYLDKLEICCMDLNFYFEVDTNNRSKFLQNNYTGILKSSYHWTSPTVFINFANQFYYLFSERKFILMIANLFLKMHSAWGDLTYVNLIKEFWHNSPIYLREYIGENTDFYTKVMKVMDGTYESDINSTFDILDSWLRDPFLIDTTTNIFVKPPKPI